MRCRECRCDLIFGEMKPQYEYSLNTKKMKKSIEIIKGYEDEIPTNGRAARNNRISDMINTIMKAILM